MALAADRFYNIVLDAWPLVHVSLHSAPANDDEFDEFQSEFIGVLEGVLADQRDNASEDRIALVMELDGIVSASFSQKMRGVGFIGVLKPYVAQTIRCTALVITSSTVRTIVEWILALRPLQSEHAVFNNEAAALAWCEANLRA